MIAKFDEKVRKKSESDKNCVPKLHFFTVGNLVKLLKFNPILKLKFKNFKLGKEN